MKNASKKFMTIVMTLALVLGMTVWAGFAADIGPNSGGKATTSDTTLNIVKTLKVSNPSLVNVAGPGLQYSFTIAPANVSPGTVITDNQGHSAAVHSGPTGGLTIGSSPSFPVTDLLNSSSSGTDNTKNIVLNTDLTKFTEPGIYRYELTDTTTSTALQEAGVDRAAKYTTVRYVDVYIQRVADTLAVEGYVVGSDNDGNGVLVKETFDTSTTTDDTEHVDYKTYDTRDIFDTYNLQLQKSVTGEMGDRHNQFPFAAALNNSGRRFYSAKETPPGSTSTLNQDGGITALSTTLADGESYYIAGLRKNDTVAYTETNNTQDVYSVTISKNGTPSAAQNVQPTGTKAMDSTVAPDATNVVFENNHGSVSPTGVIMRFGPYIGMVLIAALLILMRKRAKSN